MAPRKRPVLPSESPGESQEKTKKRNAAVVANKRTVKKAKVEEKVPSVIKEIPAVEDKATKARKNKDKKTTEKSDEIKAKKEKNKSVKEKTTQEVETPEDKTSTRKAKNDKTSGKKTSSKQANIEKEKGKKVSEKKLTSVAEKPVEQNTTGTRSKKIKGIETVEEKEKDSVSKGRKRKADQEKQLEVKSGKPKANKAAIATDGQITSPKKKIKKGNLTETYEEEIVKTEPLDDILDSKIPHITREMVQKSGKWIGAHVSISGGLYKAIEEACTLESNALGLFLRSQRRWESPPLAQKAIEEFEKKIKEKKFGCSVNGASLNGDDFSPYFDSIKDQILPHGSYLINLGNPDKEKREKSYTVFLDDLKRCDALSIALYNFHPGSTCGNATVDESLALIAECINNAHKETKRVKIVIENMAGQGNIVGSKFEELAKIIELVDDKSRIGICLDTCHLFAAGYDIRTAEDWNRTLDEFDNIVGIKYLSAMHLNDSKGPLGCNKDRHESIGKGHIGLDCFKFIMEDPRFCNMPLILETPDEKLYAEEIQLLHSFLKDVPMKKEEKN